MTFSKVRCIQRNLGKGKAATALLVKQMIDDDINIALVQEPHCTRGIPCGFPLAWTCITAPPADCPPRAIIVSKIPNWTVIQTTRDQVTGMVTIDAETFVFSSFYIPVVGAGVDNFLVLSEDIIERYRDQALILGGDANAKNELWGGHSTDPRGREIEDFITSNRLCVLNDNLSIPTYQRGHRQSWIDLTLGNQTGRCRAGDWQVEDQNTNDHRNILFSLQFEGTPGREHKRLRFCLKHGKWGKFLKLIRQQEDYLFPRLQNCTSAEMINQWYEDFLVILTRACNSSFKKRCIGRNQTVDLSWWTEELTIKKKQVAAARRRMQRTPIDSRASMKLRYNKINAEYKRLIVRTKRNSWLETCENIKNVYGLPYKALRGTLNRPTTLPVVKVGNTITTSTEESLRAIVDRLFPEDVDPRNRAQEEIHSGAYCEAGQLGADEPPFTSMEISGVIDSLPNNKAPGPDLINYEIVKKLYQGAPVLLELLFNKCLQLGCFPDLWKEGEIVLLKKAGGREDDPSSLRPICLLPTLGKVFEKLILNRLLYFGFQKKVIAKNQFGFLPQRSTIHALDLVNKTIKRNFSNDVGTMMISVDIQNAFNSVWPDSVRFFMRRHGFPRNVFTIIDNYFKDRWVQARFADSSYRKAVHRGCPQGSGLGPFLWNTVINDFLGTALPANFSMQAYADDLLILIGGNHRARLKEDIQFVFEKIYSWAEANKLNIKKEKTKAIWIPGKYKSLLLSKTRIPEVTLSQHLKYLGITYSANGSFDEHLKTVSTKVQQLNRKICSIRTGRKGIPIEYLRRIYKTVFEKIIAYGAETWANQLTKKQIGKLNSLQRAVLIKLTEAYRTTSTEALQVIANIAPLDLIILAERKRRELLLNKTRIEVLGQGIDPSDVDTGSGRFQIHPRKWSKIRWREYKEEKEQVSDINIFTDGSRTSEGTGAAYVVRLQNSTIFTGKMALAKENTHYQAETLALLEAIKWSNEHPQYKKVSIISDCQSALRSLEQVFPGKTPIDHIKQAVNKAVKEGRDIQFFWTRGHAGQIGNELADVAAKDAISNGTRYQIQKPASWVKSLLKKEVATLWQQRWTESTKGRNTYNIISCASTRNWFYSKEITQVLTQHGRIPSYMYKFGFTSSPNCICGETGDINHYIFRCGRTATLAGPVRKLQSIRNIVKLLDRYHVRKRVEDIVKYINKNLTSLMQDPGQVKDLIA